MLFNTAMFDLNIPTSISHQSIYHSFPYIASIPYFWGSMGFITAISMLITAMLFDHEIKTIWKSGLSILAFVSLLFMVTLQRVQFTEELQRNSVTYLDKGFVYAGLATIIIFTTFWALGMILGVFVLKCQKKLR